MVSLPFKLPFDKHFVHKDGERVEVYSFVLAEGFEGYLLMAEEPLREVGRTDTGIDLIGWLVAEGLCCGYHSAFSSVLYS